MSSVVLTATSANVVGVTIEITPEAEAAVNLAVNPSNRATVAQLKVLAAAFYSICQKIPGGAGIPVPGAAPITWPAANDARPYDPNARPNDYDSQGRYQDHRGHQHDHRHPDYRNPAYAASDQQRNPAYGQAGDPNYNRNDPNYRGTDPRGDNFRPGATPTPGGLMLFALDLAVKAAETAPGEL